MYSGLVSLERVSESPQQRRTQGVHVVKKIWHLIFNFETLFSYLNCILLVVLVTNMSAMVTSFLAGSKLTYFAMPGRGEAIRLAFAISGTPLVDEKVTFGEWGELKKTLMIPQLPFFQVGDNQPLWGHRSILRLCGKEFDLVPTNPIECAKVDMVMDISDDIVSFINKILT